MNILSLTEIPNWKAFENLVASYFRQVKEDKEFNIATVYVQPTGTGSDGGRDILVTFLVDDSVLSFQRKWIIQCKFYKPDVNKSHLSKINIPSLLHEYGADGYLLVCKNDVTAPVSKMFEGFNSECPFKRKYHIWNGNYLLERIKFKDSIIQQYFPKHYKYSKQKQVKADKLIEGIK